MRSNLYLLRLSGMYNLSNIYINHTFEDPYFNNMMIFQAAVGGDTKVKKYPQLTKTMLLEYVKAEYSIFCVLLNLMINMKCNQIHGSVFAQGINDGVTLEN